VWRKKRQPGKRNGGHYFSCFQAQHGPRWFSIPEMASLTTKQFRRFSLPGQYLRTIASFCFLEIRVLPGFEMLFG
jgi:hypothetical protein